MVNMEPYAVRHVLSANLAGVVISLFNTFPEFFGHQSPLVLCEIFSTGCFKPNIFQFVIKIQDILIAVSQSVYVISF